MKKIEILSKGEIWDVYSNLVGARLFSGLLKKNTGKITISVMRDTNIVFVNCVPELLSEVSAALDLDNFSFQLKKD